ncbi:hypothetical protein [Micromonospora sp. NPDC023956]|uniref:hypothetical protein n=1 Tax=Micromonospora sp. NPDC023956 TaxID=3155722 RepID=UPI0033DEDDC6
MIFKRRPKDRGRDGARIPRPTRLKAYSTVVGLAVASLVVVTPAAAQAGAIVACPTDLQYWNRYGSVWEAHRYRIVSSTPVFLASDGRAVSNGLTYPVSATVTATQTRTHQVTTSVGVATQLTEQLTINVSTQIVQIRSTAVGVSTTFEVQPNQTVYADYGVHAYQVSYYVEKWRARGSMCEEWGYYPSTVTAPTYVEGWQLRLG